MLREELDLVAVALALGAREVRGWSAAEEDLVAGASEIEPGRVEALRDRIIAGDDPLASTQPALDTFEASISTMVLSRYGVTRD